MHQQADLRDFVIIGGGAAGFSAALYAARYLMSATLIEGEFGGETATASTIENWPGTKAIDGYDLMLAMKQQIQALDVPIVSGFVTKAERTPTRTFVVETREGEHVEAKTLLLAIGAARKKLGLPDEDRLRGKGISYCSTCDAPLYRGKRVAVVGGGDASIKGANLLAKFADEIFILVRGTTLRAEPFNQRLLEQQMEDKQVHVLYETQVSALQGDTQLRSIRLTKPFDGQETLTVDGLMVEIGAEPIRDLPSALGVTLDAKGYIVTDTLMRTNVPGVYAAGDCTNLFGHFKQDITAACEGAVAATSAHEFLQQGVKT